jgi:hypothetical protein
MALRRALLAIGLLLASAGAAAQDDERNRSGAEQRRLERWTSPRLTRFRSEEEFRRYLRDVQAVAEEAVPVHYPPAPVPAPPPSGFSAPESSAVVVTGSRIPSPNLESASPVTTLGSTPDNPTITNVQEQGVDEGDIVKQVGRFLLVLQDARIFSIDTAAGSGGSELALADRIDVYRSADDDTWYDEMLVFGDRVVVTGYSYGEDATQFTVLRLAPDGRLSREGTFFLSSNDYYDEDNYATRLVGDRLVIYSPLFLADVDLDEAWEWPAIRRWRPEDADAEEPRRGRPIMDARSIHRPVATHRNPVIHSVSMCSLGPAAAASDDLGCETMAFIGPDDREMYVTPTDAWLWTYEDPDERWDERELDDCRFDFRPAADQTHPAQLWRMPLRGGALNVAGVRGEPMDQMSLAVIGERFHALTRWQPATCANADEPIALSFASIPLSRLGRRLREVPPAAYAPVPDIGEDELENRFTDRSLVYGGRTGEASDPPEAPVAAGSQLVVVPVTNPHATRILSVPHNVIRLERVGSDLVATGYRDDAGLDLSLVALGSNPHVASTARLPGRYETEGRSHAFNSSVGADGNGLIGIPTAPRILESGRHVWRSGASDISYLSREGWTLRPAGELLRSEAPPRSDYRCEVSCIDWYGNSRPIFTGGRIFALIGTELVEGRLAEGRVRELRRLDLTAPPPLRSR